MFHIPATYQQTYPTSPTMDTGLVLLQLFMLLLVGINFVLSIVVICLNFKAFKYHWKPGLMVGIALLVIYTLSYSATFLLVDIREASGVHDVPLPVLYVGASVVLLCFAVLQAGWYMAVYVGGAGEWDRARLPGFALLSRGEPGAWSGIMIGAGFGVFAGIVSTVLMVLIGIDVGPMLAEMMQIYESITEQPMPVRFVFYSLLVTGPAIAEELTFRGLMFGLFLRLSKNNTALIVLSTLVVSVLWSLLHIPNTNMPLVKCMQIFLISLVLCELARRKGIEAAIAGHVMLNLSAVAIAVPLE